MSHKKQHGNPRDRQVSAFTGRGAGCGRGRDWRGDNKRPNNNWLSREVDWKVIFFKRYSKQEFRSLTKPQSEVVIDLNHQKLRGNNDSNDATVSGLTLSGSQDGMITLGDAIGWSPVGFGGRIMSIRFKRNLWPGNVVLETEATRFVWKCRGLYSSTSSTSSTQMTSTVHTIGPFSCTHNIISIL